MTLRSMTGFGEATGFAGAWETRVNVRSVNHRQLDVRVTLPGELSAAEPKLIALVRERLHRGRVDVKVAVTRTDDGTDGDLAAAASRLRDVATTFDLPPITMSDLLRFAQLGGAKESVTIDVNDVIGCAGNALDKLCAFREREGRALASFFAGHIGTLSRLLTDIEAAAGADIARHRARLAERVEGLLGSDNQVDSTRLEQEIVLIAERSDITEEIQRAGEHVRALQDLIGADTTGPKGKRLDFLLQELIRETNTMASKSASAAVTHLVVEAKTAVEQLREQALNIE